jgi:hypothetical protein
MDRLRCLLCGALFDGPTPRELQDLVAQHQKAAAHPSIALQRVRP